MSSNIQQPIQPTGVQVATPMQRLSMTMEQTWVQIGNVAECMNDKDRAHHAFERALQHNPYSIKALAGIGHLFRSSEAYPKAVELYQKALTFDSNNGELWGYLGYCYLMLDELVKAYTAYQQALCHLPNPKEPKLWFGIGILYDRYGSSDHAEEAFTAVLKMDPKFEKANEVYFRLGMIYKQQKKFSNSIDCFRYILENPPKPLSSLDLWYQIGHVHECQKDFNTAKSIYDKILKENPDHVKTLQQLGWLFSQDGPLQNYEYALKSLLRAIELDGNDAYGWYLLGRCYTMEKQYNKAYEAFQQAVYRDGRNPLFWCSIGLLYFKINQYRDALDAYSRAIHINPCIKEVWFNLAVLYESCNNQVNDAVDAYHRAFEIDNSNEEIKNRLMYLKSVKSNGGNLPADENVNPIPEVRDIDPNTFHPVPANGKMESKPIGNPPYMGSGSIFPPKTQQSQPQQLLQQQTQHEVSQNGHSFNGYSKPNSPTEVKQSNSSSSSSSRGSMSASMVGAPAGIDGESRKSSTSSVNINNETSKTDQPVSISVSNTEKVNSPNLAKPTKVDVLESTLPASLISRNSPSPTAKSNGLNANVSEGSTVQSISISPAKTNSPSKESSKPPMPLDDEEDALEMEESSDSEE